MLRPTWRASRFVLARTFADPVREGRLRDDGWPPGLRAVVGAAVVVYAVLMLAAVFASVVRAHDRLLFVPPGTTLPRLAVPLLGTGLVLALACLQSAVIHVRVPLRVAGTAVVVAVLLDQVDWTDVGPADLVTVGFIALLPLLVLSRVRRPFHWLEPVVALVAVGGAVVAYQGVGLTALAETSPGLRISRLDTLLIPLWGLAAPVSILAGAALVEITTVATTWSVATAWDVVGRRPRGRRWTTVLLVALVVGRAVQETRRFADPTALVGTTGLLVAAALTAVAFVLGAAVTAVADRAGGGDPRRRHDPADVVAAWRGTAPYLALALAAGIGLQSLVAVLLHAVGLTQRRARRPSLRGSHVGARLRRGPRGDGARHGAGPRRPRPAPDRPRAHHVRDDVRCPGPVQRRRPGRPRRTTCSPWCPASPWWSWASRRCAGVWTRPRRSRWPACSRWGSPTRSATGSPSRSRSWSA